MERPSRSMMLRHKPRSPELPITDGNAKVQVVFERGTTSLLVIRSSDVTREFLQIFCDEHNLTLTEKNGYYYLS